MIRKSIFIFFIYILVLNVVSQELPSFDKRSGKGRIVGGFAVSSITSFPYQVALYAGNGFCGGSIIGPTKVLTAAHCVQGVSSSSITISVGSLYRYNSASLYYASSYKIHPSYDVIPSDYDIAVITTTVPFVTSTSVKPIPLATTRPATNSIVYVSGWGSTSSGGTIVDYLRYVDVKIVDQATCNAQYGGSLTSRMICAANPGKDACQGDSGGPLIANGKLVGVVSFGVGCALPDFSGVYASVADLWTWIVAQ